MFLARSLLGRLTDRSSTGPPELVTSFDFCTQSAQSGAQSAAEKRFCRRCILLSLSALRPALRRCGSMLNVRLDLGVARLAAARRQNPPTQANDEVAP
jgi:hypothetical protein